MAAAALKKALLGTMLLTVLLTLISLGVNEYTWHTQHPQKPSPLLVSLEKTCRTLHESCRSRWNALTAAVRAKQVGGEAEARAAAAPPSVKSAYRTAPPLPERGDDQLALQGDFAAILAEKASSCSIFFLRPRQEQEPLLFQDHAMQPASMIKLFVLACAMQDAKDGRLALDEPLSITPENIVDGAGRLTWYDRGKSLTALQLMERMITDSDNTATNILIDRLGMRRIDSYIQQKGYAETRLQHKMMLGNQGLPNLSSVRDIGTLLTRIYRHECVDPEHDEMMLAILARQTDKECLPAALPSFRLANKTGEITGFYADGGIARGETDDMILVVMDENCRDRSRTIPLFQKIAQRAASSL